MPRRLPPDRPDRRSAPRSRRHGCGLPSYLQRYEFPQLQMQNERSQTYSRKLLQQPRQPQALRDPLPRLQYPQRPQHHQRQHLRWQHLRCSGHAQHAGAPQTGSAHPLRHPSAPAPRQMHPQLQTLRHRAGTRALRAEQPQQPGLHLLQRPGPELPARPQQALQIPEGKHQAQPVGYDAPAPQPDPQSAHQ